MHKLAGFLSAAAVVAAPILFNTAHMQNGELSRGTCGTFDKGVTVCVPGHGPDNTRRNILFEDGSATYGPKHNRWVYDPDTSTFRR